MKSALIKLIICKNQNEYITKGTTPIQCSEPNISDDFKLITGTRLPKHLPFAGAWRPGWFAFKVEWRFGHPFTMTVSGSRRHAHQDVRNRRTDKERA
jgi:hypothetical protein